MVAIENAVDQFIQVIVNSTGQGHGSRLSGGALLVLFNIVMYEKMKMKCGVILGICGWKTVDADMAELNVRGYSL